MAKLYFRYGAMNSGKSSAIIQVAHNYEERNMRVFLIKPATDTKGNDKVVSRIGVHRTVDLLVNQPDDIFKIISKHNSKKAQIRCVLVDEAQFLHRAHIDQLLLIATKLDIPVICYGIRIDFKTEAFPGSIRLFELAHSIEELKTICRCGKKAIYNGRKINNKFVSEGDQVAIDGESSVTYESLCANCYLKFVGPTTIPTTH